MLFRCRRYLPHLEAQGSTYFVTYRLYDSVPQALLEQWKSEREELRRKRTGLSKYQATRLKYLFSNRIQEYIDQGRGECWLQNPRVAELVVETFIHFNNQRYLLHAWCVMPNHVHVVFTVKSKDEESQSDLIPILHSWKSYTAHQANKILQRRGKFWQDEYYESPDPRR